MGVGCGFTSGAVVNAHCAERLTKRTPSAPKAWGNRGLPVIPSVFLRAPSARKARRWLCQFLFLTELLLLCCGALVAQDAPPEATDTTAQPAAPSEPQSVRVLGMESTGTVDIGYRWKAGFQGSEDLYRSLVNLGEGPKLFGANLNFSNPLGTGKYVDRLQINATSWGGDPYNTLRVYAEKASLYQFSFDYRNVNYFNFIPSFANPLLSQGILLGQHSFDSTRRTMDFELTLRPGAKISPFLARSLKPSSICS